MHIHRLTISNFKRIKAATFELPASGTFEVAGRNGAGKSSTIDAIWSALGGSKASPGKPVRDGSQDAIVTLDLGEIRVQREWDGKGTRLTVVDAGGSQLRRPQELLDSLFSRLAFDPMEFARQTATKQAETLRNVAGLDFTKLDAERARTFEERTQVNKAVKQQEAALANLPEVEPTEPTSAAELLKQLQEATAENNAIASARQAVVRKQDEITRRAAELDSVQSKIAELQARLADLNEAQEAAIDEKYQLEGFVEPEIDTTAIVARLGEVEAINRRARDYQERKAAEEALQGNRAHAEELTDAIERIDAARRRMLSEAEFPVDGLSLDGDVVTVNRIPFDQISSSEQIRVSLAMAASLNPKLRLIIVKEGSLLDDASLRIVAQWAEEHDYQVVIERVADASVGRGIVIEEGRIVSNGSPQYV